MPELKRLNEIVYADNTEPILFVKEVKHLYSGVYFVTFSNDEKRLFDTIILQGEVFAPLSDPLIYENPSLEFGIVTWAKGTIDCSPDFMYENSFEYNTKDIVVA